MGHSSHRPLPAAAVADERGPGSTVKPSTELLPADEEALIKHRTGLLITQMVLPAPFSSWVARRSIQDRQTHVGGGGCPPWATDVWGCRKKRGKKPSHGENPKSAESAHILHG